MKLALERAETKPSIPIINLVNVLEKQQVEGIESELGKSFIDDTVSKIPEAIYGTIEREKEKEC